MGKALNEATLKGRRGIRINPDKSSVADVIRNEAALQGWTISTVAVLSNINPDRLYSMLQGDVGITEREVSNIEAALGIEIPRDRLTPIKWKLTK